MKTKEENIIELDGFHAEELKIIKLSLQDLKSTENAIEYNKQHNYEYKFVAENLINTECLLPLIRKGYKIAPFCNDVFKNDVIIIYHDNEQ